MSDLVDIAGDAKVKPTTRSALRRKRERGSYDRELIYSILDEAMICHVGFTEGDSVFVVPTVHVRVGDHLYLHGAAANRMLAVSAAGSPICVTATIVDGLVFARSAIHHSMNYRSVMVFAEASKVTDEEEKRTAAIAIVDHVAPGRSADARPPTSTELKSTAIVRVRIDEASAKVRTGPPIDDEEDLELPIWAGWLPLETTASAPVVDPQVPDGVGVPSYVSAYPSRRRHVTG